ncbi:23S rRNA (adenine(2503)-C(2))-methyltransferase RlmN [Algisphaera agarilytica]|uniref:Probable dual-specificity RNA methyltransferase RlmN n=1 Tax=Algisphaera agarilytica TaxID=1385975 RepID=A0A7X0H5C4_9BACT|nr:23S rRNA (adenine(2503)-C(2))-methyltransferase RlmN [Algisphaera agarilytica]MBB6428421.1 23S rRNA (adenine2503-C2)-methyltransferase [Algisphaera agarilytica]
MPDDRPHFFDHTPDTLGELFQTWGLARFRAKQVMDWVYAKGVADPQQMTNLAAKDRDLLAEKMRFLDGAVIQHQRATDGTQKLLVDWSLDARASHTGTSLTVLGSSETQTECVMIPSTSQKSGRTRRTACISSQVGCPVGCKFCASGLGGLDGNLTTGQIVQQAWQLSWELGDGDWEVGNNKAVVPKSKTPNPKSQNISNIVFMGMGEPMANLRNVLPAVRTLAADWGMGLSARKITVSTVGVPAGIRKLADLELPVTLAISLHAPNDEIRKRIIPWAEFVSIEQLTDAGRDYFNKTGREITLEYILLGGLNDQPEHAHELVGVTRKLRSNVNLIRYNEVAGLPFLRPSDGDVHTFQNILQQAGVNTHIRASRGRDIAAACGQLRHEATNV